MKRQLALLVVTALVGLTLAQADPHHPDTTPATQNQNAAPAQLLPMPGGTAQTPMGQQGMMPMAQMMQMMQGMMGQGQMGMAGSGLMMLEGAPFEQAFLSMMIPHHRAAVTMARDVLGKTQDSQIRAWANAIIRDQEREISQMRALLGALGGTNLAAQRMMTQGMTQGMGMGGMMPNQGAGGMMQAPGSGNMMQSPATGNAAQAPQAPVSPERAFLQAMIPHHLQAVEMATLALQKAQNPVIVKLASDIVRAQAQEVYQMRLKLASLR
ncbi:DUF305 domain-containing protein [uncultured Meiothermus sp.]|jgi:uncharacterized protein (DUF305 family)|uniref:DUF305 domain-containing protein n=1 Tax=uncultured Meiothermus sp. TaxID=157471 RepID=UPI002620E470|nr:DUF305 domain-containing protein [uncultured Meiothermus sp.]